MPFAEDGFALQGGRALARGRDAIRAAYAGQGANVKHRARSYATADTVGWIIGAYRYGDTADDQGKFTVTLRRARGGQWLILSDMDNTNPRRQKRKGDVHWRRVESGVWRIDTRAMWLAY